MEEVEAETLGEDFSGDIAIEGTPPSSRSRSPERLIEETVYHPEKDADDIVQGECTSNSNKILTNECAIREERMEETKHGKKERKIIPSDRDTIVIDDDAPDPDDPPYHWHIHTGCHIL